MHRYAKSSKSESESLIFSVQRAWGMPWGGRWSCHWERESNWRSKETRRRTESWWVNPCCFQATSSLRGSNVFVCLFLLHSSALLEMYSFHLRTSKPPCSSLSCLQHLKGILSFFNLHSEHDCTAVSLWIFQVQKVQKALILGKFIANQSYRDYEKHSYHHCMNLLSHSVWGFNWGQPWLVFGGATALE